MHRPTRSQESDNCISFSIVICTDGRAEALRNTLSSLDHLDYDRFEVCVVCGPTKDGTRELLDEYSGRIKVAYNPKRNLSISRNIGIALAAGQVVAFIDDDCIPEPEWMRDLADSYKDSDVGGAGGFVYNHLGTGFQSRYSTVNRLGRPTIDYGGPVDNLCFPMTANVPHLLGTNSSFRRAALLSVGGFDEEYDYYLDETDVMLRIADAGWLLKIIDGAYVHHKFLPSTIRNVDSGFRVIRQWYSIVKNRIYFALRHYEGHFTLTETIDDLRGFIDELLHEIDWAVDEHLLTEDDRARFWKEVDLAWHDGMQHAFGMSPRFISRETLTKWYGEFLPFQPVVPNGGRRTFCLVSQEYTPGQMGGIGRYTHELAKSISAMGHDVHVIAQEGEYDRIDYARGVWIHWVTSKETTAKQPDGLRMPAHLWRHAVAVTQCLDDIAAKRKITAVCAPIWDCEGIGVLAQGRYPLVTMLQTSMVPYLASNPTRASDRKFVREHARPMIQAETYVMQRSHRVVACTHAILDEMDQMYGVSFEPHRLSLIPYAIGDWNGLPYELPEPLPPESVRLLFVGRVEERKGVDVLLNCAMRVLAKHPNVYLDLVGNDFIPGPKGRTFRDIFESDPKSVPLRERVRFHGMASDESLRGFYRDCDIVVAPSRFESFGLMLVEAMIFGKPVIACRTGGMPEVADEGVTGLIAEPGDEASLEQCLERLVTDSALRHEMGIAARSRYERLFHTDRVASAMVECFISTGDLVFPLESSQRQLVSSPAGKSTAIQTTNSKPRLELVEARRCKAVIIAPMLAQYDGISNAVRDSYRMFMMNDKFDVHVLAIRCDFRDMNVHLVGGLDDLVDHQQFLDADILMYHFGVYNELFNALICGNGHALQVVHFHNVTPIEFVTPAQVPLVQDSYRQMNLLTYADAIWAVSHVNKQVLEERGIGTGPIRVVPSVVDEPQLAATSQKTSQSIQVLFMGRGVPSKGLLDLVKAIDLARQNSVVPMHLRIAGSEEWSDTQYMASVKLYVNYHQLEDIVEFVGAVNDAERQKLYHAAHVLAMPSYHEGFCKPVIEGLRSGCIPVGYAAYNLPPITNGFGRLVKPGDIELLADALVEIGRELLQAMRTPDLPLLPLDRGVMSLRDFETLATRYVQEFTFASVAELTTQYLEELMSSSGLAGSPPVPVPSTSDLQPGSLVMYAE